MAEIPDAVKPVISPTSPTGEIMRFTLQTPKDAGGREIYTLNDLKSLQDFTLERLFRRVPRIADLASYGGTMKRYEIQPDPARLQRYGITLQQLEQAVADANSNVGGQYIAQGQTVQVVRGMGLIGLGEDPMEKAMSMDDPLAAASYLRQKKNGGFAKSARSCWRRSTTCPIRVDDVVDGGPLGSRATCRVPGASWSGTRAAWAGC